MNDKTTQEERQRELREMTRKEIEEVDKKNAEEEAKEKMLSQADTGETKLVCVLDRIKEDLERIEQEAKTATTSTGFYSLDNELGGGLRAGNLIVLGAVPSLGKTTLALNIADNVAKSGRDVLFFSLEMSRAELVLKSLSRQTFMPANKEQISLSYAKTMATKASSMLANYGKNRTEIQRKEWEKAVETYCKDTAPWLHIVESSGLVEGKTIRKEIESFILEKEPSLKPLVIVDYMQIIAAPSNTRMTDKQAVDANMTELKRIARDNKVSIIAVSSFNRENYYAEVGYESFKESGGIDYGADVVLGLQLVIDGNKEERRERYDEAKNAEPRTVELKVIKNRMFKSGGRITFDYYPKYDCFCEAGIL